MVGGGGGNTTTAVTATATMTYTATAAAMMTMVIATNDDTYDCGGKDEDRHSLNDCSVGGEDDDGDSN